MNPKISAELMAHKLWTGSVLDTANKYGYLEYDHLLDKIKAMQKCDDLTAAESEFLTLLINEVELKGWSVA